MASNKKNREVQFTLNDDDYKAFGRYRIMYTDQGHKLVRRQKLTFVLIGIGVALLFTVFHVDKNFTMLMYAASAVCAIGGLVFGESMVLRQQDRVIDNAKGDIERVHPVENRIRFGEDGFDTYAGDDEQHFKYSDIKLVDFTEAGLYVWLSDTMIMPIPLHSFRNMSEMKDFNKWLGQRIEESKGTAAE